MTLYSELMQETATRLGNPDYFTPVDYVPAHMGRAVLNRTDIFQGGQPGNELPIKAVDVPTVLRDLKIDGIVPVEVLIGSFAGHEGLKALPWLARPVDPPSLQRTIDEDDVRTELLTRIPIETRLSVGKPELIAGFAINMRNLPPLVIVDATTPLASKEKQKHIDALARSAKELSGALFMLIESRQNVTLLGK